jgi:ribosome-binding protein aMBF1 (putative translation factor)
MKKMMTHDEFLEKSLKNPEFKKVYDSFDLEYKLIDAIIEQRIKHGVTQKQLAEKIGTKQSAIARFESGNFNFTFAFVKKLANALGVKITATVG